MSLAGRRLLITGAASGIGRSLLDGAVAGGAECAVLVRDQTEAGTLAAVLPSSRIHVVDLRNVERVAGSAREAIASLGDTLDGLACSAGVFDHRGALETDLQQWQAVLDVNLTAAFEVARECARVMATAGRGSIVLVSSQIGIIRGPCAAKRLGARAVMRPTSACWLTT